VNQVQQLFMERLVELTPNLMLHVVEALFDEVEHRAVGGRKTSRYLNAAPPFCASATIAAITSGSTCLS
jgi:hypothetical protein